MGPLFTPHWLLSLSQCRSAPLPQLGLLKRFLYSFTKTEKHNGETGRLVLGVGAVFKCALQRKGGRVSELLFPKRTGCAFGGGPGPPYRPLLNSDNANQPAMSSGRRGGPPPGGPPPGGAPPGGSPGPPGEGSHGLGDPGSQPPQTYPSSPRIVRREGGHRLF